MHFDVRMARVCQAMLNAIVKLIVWVRNKTNKKTKLIFVSIIERFDFVDGSDEATIRCPTKTGEQLHGKCDRNSFQCDNGECINVDAMCDGSPDCR